MSALWVRVPVIAAGAATMLTLAYGPGQWAADSIATWQDYAAVIHFEPPGFIDVSPSGLHAQQTGDVAGATGNIGGAVAFNTHWAPMSTETFGSLEYLDSGDLNANADAFTLELWTSSIAAINDEPQFGWLTLFTGAGCTAQFRPLMAPELACAAGSASASVVPDINSNTLLGVVGRTG